MNEGANAFESPALERRTQCHWDLVFLLGGRAIFFIFLEALMMGDDDVLLIEESRFSERGKFYVVVYLAAWWIGNQVSCSSCC